MSLCQCLCIESSESQWWTQMSFNWIFLCVYSFAFLTPFASWVRVYLIVCLGFFPFFTSTVLLSVSFERGTISVDDSLNVTYLFPVELQNASCLIRVLWHREKKFGFYVTLTLDVYLDRLHKIIENGVWNHVQWIPRPDATKRCRKAAI